MGDVLSQTEVESLLAALDSGSPVGSSGGGGSGSGGGRVTRMDDGLAQISVYDFKRPERVSKEQMRGFQALHEGFSRELGAALSGMLRTIVEVKLISVDQLTYSEFVFSLENPTCFNLLKADPLEGHLILDLNPSIIFPIIDRLLGGGKDASATAFPRRPLTEIELRLVARITDRAIECLRGAWATVCDLRPKVTQVESNPQLVQIVPPNEVIVLISFEVSMGEVRGIMNLCIPYNTIEPLTGKLSSDSWSAYTKKAVDPQQQLNLETGVQRASVQLVVHLAKGTLSARDLASLAVGDVILTETEQQHGAEVLVAGTPLFKALPGTLKGHKAITMGSRLTKPKEMIARRMAELGVTLTPDGKNRSGRRGSSS